MLISRFSNEKAEIGIEKIEKKYSVRLPSEYRRFLVEYNGGDTPNTKYTSANISFPVRGFLGVGNVRYSLDRFEDLSEWMARKQLPIACDSFGNYLSISLDTGAIYLMDHERGFKKTFLCDDFATLITRCESAPIHQKALRSIQEREADLIARGRGHIITDGLRKMWQAEIDKYTNMTLEEVAL